MSHVNIAVRLACLAVVLTGLMVLLSSSFSGSHTAASNEPAVTDRSSATDDSASTRGQNSSSASVLAEPNGQQQQQARISEAYGKLPLSFEANQGQADPQVKFLSRGSGYSLFLTSTEAVLALSRVVNTEGSNQLAGEQKAADLGQGSTSPAVLRMKLLGANPRPQVTGVERQAGETSYFIGNDRSQWRTNIGNYAQVRYESVYPGIDVIYYGNQRQLEYDFVVAPGANPDRIRLAFAGADKMYLDANGELVLNTAVGEVQQHKPVLYQEVDGVRREVAGRYVIKGARKVGFEVGAYDRSRALVIDPVLVYSTYLGGTSTDRGFGIAVDGSGNAYITGVTSSSSFPTSNPLQAARNGSNDAFVLKLNPAGSALVYATYLGGSGTDTGTGIAVDGSGNAYVTGFTVSSNFPTVSPLQSTHKGGRQDFFVAKLNAAGSALTYSTYLGGSGYDFPVNVAVDLAGNAYLTGYTESVDFPTVNALQPVKKGTPAFKSINGGGSWSPSSTGLNTSTVNAFAVDPVTATTVYAATSTGVYKSTDSGNNWSAANQGLPGVPVRDIVIDRTSPLILYAATDSGPYKTTDGGATWNLLGNGTLSFEIKSLAIDPSDHLTIYAGAFVTSNIILFKSTDGGANWTPSDNQLNGNYVQSIAVDPTNPSLVYAATNSGLYKSFNGGFSWTLSSGSVGFAPLDVVIDPTNPATLYIGTDGGGLWKSTNGGTSWAKTNLPAAFYIVYSVIIDPLNPATIYAGTNGQNVSKSTDGGNTWSSTTLGFALNAEIVLAINPANTSVLYAGGNAGTDALLVKLNPSGTGLVYSTFLGGDASDFGDGIAVDAAGNAYLAGSTESLNFPIANALQGAHTTPYDAFVAKVNPTGSAFVYSTYLGGSDTESGQGIAVDSGGNAYVTGHTTSVDFPTVNAFQGTCDDCQSFGSDAFVTKINASGSAFVYSSYYGGNSSDTGHGIAVDSTGSAYITGETDSTTLPALSAPQPTKNLSDDAFVAKINPAGTALVYSTYLGGGGQDIGSAIAVGPEGSAYITGYTASTNFPTASPLQANYANSGDAFVTRIGPSDASGASADLSLTMTDSPDPAQNGQSITYTVTVTNHGPSAASGVIVNNTITQPQFVNSASATPSQGTCASNLTCTLGNLASGAQATITVVVTPGVSGPASITNSATVGGNEPDPVTANNSATESTMIGIAYTISGQITRANSSAISGVTVTLQTNSFSTTTTTDSQGNYSFTGLAPGTSNTVTPSLANFSFSPSELNFNNLSQNITGANFVGTPVATPSTLQLNQSSYSLTEGAGSLALLVNRSGDLSSAVTVNYATSDAAAFLQNCNVVNGHATSRCDYVSLVGTLHFAAGENSKTLFLPIVDDTYLEGAETLSLTLSSPTGGAVIGANSSAVITITDSGNDGSGQPNPIDETNFFVRQHYIDFLGREPDPASIGWNNQINNCVPVQPACDRLSVSQGIYSSPEFKDRGYFIYKFYSVAFGRKPTYDEFVLDRARVSGFQTEAELEQSKLDFIADFMSRPEFAPYGGLTNDQYVQTLFNMVGLTQITVNGVVRDVAAIQQQMAGGRTRAQVLRDIAESPEVSNKFLVESTIVMHYFGYLRRDPDAAYQDWINIYNQTGDSRNVTNGFVNSAEYRSRFSSN
jgi:uncharacterized repeat protein (TIGR01451 family)